MILYAPVPVLLCSVLDLQQFARLDVRFADSARLALDPAALVQDSAALLGAYLTLRTPEGDHIGRPDGITGPVPVRLDRWRRALQLDLSTVREVESGALGGVCQESRGVVYTFRAADPKHRDGENLILLRQYALTNWFDRLELEFLLGDGLPGVDLLHGHVLDTGARLCAWRCRVTPVQGA